MQLAISGIARGPSRSTGLQLKLGAVLCGVAVLLSIHLNAADPVRLSDSGAGAAASSDVQRHGRSLRGSIEHLPMVLLRGTLEERGEAYGALCGKDVVRLLDEVLLPVINLAVPGGWTGLSAMVEKTFVFPEWMEAQMTAFLRGFQNTLPPEQRVVPLLNRELGLIDLKVLQAFADLASSGRIKFGGCSSFSAWGPLTGGNGVITGRNLDYFTFPGRMPMLLIAQAPEEPGHLDTLEVAVAGFFGASTAMNEEGVVVMLHDEPGLRTERAGGWVPRIVPLREAIEGARAATATEDIARTLRGKPSMMGANVHVSFPRIQGAGDPLPAVLEWDGHDADAGVTVRRADDSEFPAIFCTNHYLKRGRPRPDDDSARRYDLLVRAARERLENGDPIDGAYARKMMDRAAARGFVSTYISVIAFPAERRLQVAVASKTAQSATDGPWVDVRWQDVFGRN